MAELHAQPKDVSPAPVAPLLTCRLRQKQGFDLQGRRRSPLAGELELQNTSSGAIEIEWQMSPMQYLDLIVTAERGEVISTTYYGIIFSPYEEPQALRLLPGEKYVGPVDLLGNVPNEKQGPGRYTVQAVYAYRDIRVVSEPLEIQV